MMKLKYGYIIALVVLVATLALFAACDNTQPVEQPTQYQLTFYAQGQVHSTLQISGNQRINMPASPEKAGYIFNGWYLDEGTWNTLLTADAFADKAVDADLTVYAKYTPIKYALTYELGGAEQSNPAEYTIEQQLVLQDAVKQHYDFVGWYTDAELTTPIFEIPVGTTGNMTLYPKFAPTAYKATFMDGETVVGEVTYTVETDKIQAPEVPEHAGFVGAWEEYELIPGGITVNAKYEAVDYTITYEGVKASEHKNPAGYDVTLEPITLVDAEREHYLFAGWYTDAECTNRVTEIAAGTTGDLVLYAKWTPVAYKAVFMDGETVVGEVTYTVETESIEAPAVPEHVGYTGEWEKFELTPGGVTVNAVYTEIVYTLTYEGVLPEEHENPAEYDATQWHLVLGEAVREHYVFAGWYTEPEFENLVTEIAEGTTGDLVLYAKWTPVEYTAVFTDGETEQEVIYTVETESIELPEVPARPGYAGEWEAFELTPGGVTVNAVYTLITYTVTYENTKDVVHANPASYTVETETVTLADLSKPGYIFNGWYVGENRVTEIASGSTGDVVLTASWTAIVYEIKLHFDPAWGEYAEATNPLTYTVEDTVVFAELTCKVPGYVFDGWYTEKNRGEGTKITELSGVIGDVELYAQFVPIRYTITYVGAEDAMYVNPGVYTIESDAIHLYPAMMDGYVFGGWFADEQLSVPASLVIPTGSMGDITLYTKWTPITYVIEYEGNGGVLPENPVIYNTTQTITLKNPTRAGYVFLGWFDAPEDGEQVLQIVPGTTGNLKLYAYWEPIYYSITYHLYGGENVLVDMQALLQAYLQGNLNGALLTGNLPIYTADFPVVPLLAASKPGYTFEGWYADPAYTQRVYMINPATLANVELYAKWSLAEYNIEYVLPTGAVHENALSYNVNSDAWMLQPAMLDGWIFEGWYSDEACTIRITQLPSTGVYGDLTLYAKFIPKKYNVWLGYTEPVSYIVTFYPNGIEGESFEQTVTTSQGLVYPEIPTREGYLFAGWYDNADCTGFVYDMSAPVMGDTVLYAKWIAYESYVSLNIPKEITLNGAVEQRFTFVALTNTVITITTEGNLDTRGKLYDAKGNLLVESDDTTVSNKNFAIVWHAVAGEEYTIVVYGFGESVQGDVTLNVSGYSLIPAGGVAYLPNLREICSGETFKLPVPEDRYLYKFLGWADENGVLYTNARGNSLQPWNTDADVILYELWEEMYYEVSFDSNGGSAVDSFKVYTYETLDVTDIVPTRKGYRFIGWSLNGELFEQGIMPDHAIELVACWEEIEYTITYENLMGVANNNVTIYTVTSETIVLEDLSKPGYVFNGWYVGENRVTEIALGSTGDVVLTASWTPIEYKLNLHFDPAWGEYAEETNPLTYTVEDSITLIAPVCKIPGYVFDGWYTAKNLGEGTKVTQITDSVEDIELYAHFVPQRYTITYVGVEGATNNNPTMYTIESAALNIQAASKAGYIFGGWFADEQLSVPASLLIPTGSMGDITLYTKWTPITYVIEYEGNGGVLPENPVIYNTTQTITLKNPTRAGYVFLGWFDAPEDGEQVLQIVPGTTGNLKLYAYWEPIYYSITYYLYGGENVQMNAPLYTVESQTITLQPAIRPGYTFEGWYADPAYTQRVYMINPATLANVELYAKWSLATYSVTYDLPVGATHDNPATYTVLDQLDALNPATLEGYTFQGWYKDAAHTIEVTHLLGTGKYEDVTLYAKFVPKQYFVWLGSDEDNSHDVTFDPNFDEQETFVQTVTPEQGLAYPELPVRAGYLFAGWYDNAACEGEVFDLSAPVMGDTVLYAKWIAYEKAVSINAPIAVTLNGVTEYKFTFVSLVDTVITVKTEGLLDTFGALYDAEGNLLLANDDVATDHKNFELIYQVVAGCEYTIAVRGFSEAVQGTTTLSVSGFATVPAGGKAYLENLYTVSTGAMFKLPVPEAREGYQFLGWADENDVMYTNAMGISLQAWSTDADVVLHEVWVELV